MANAVYELKNAWLTLTLQSSAQTQPMIYCNMPLEPYHNSEFKTSAWSETRTSTSFAYCNGLLVEFEQIYVGLKSIQHFSVHSLYKIVLLDSQLNSKQLSYKILWIQSTGSKDRQLAIVKVCNLILQLAKHVLVKNFLGYTLGLSDIVPLN